MNKEVVSKRDDIIRKNNFQLLKIFDTNEHEDYKDVVLVYDPVDKRKKVLRVGEHRAKNFLYKGYNGKKLVIPKIYKINTVKNNQYEIEEFIHGKLIYECFGPPLATRIMPDKYMNLMIEAFWEFQRLAQKVKLPKYEIWHKKFLKHYGHAVKLINDKSRIATILKTKKIKDFFEDNNYVCKWKFSVDNLLITPDNKLGFIDLANVGKRFWGYDLGWIFWPGWFQLPITQYKKSAEHFSYLEKLFRKVEKKAPKNIKRDIAYNGYFIIFARVIGALFDLSARISHAKKINRNKKKRKEFIKFLNELLILTVNKLEKYE